MSGRSYTFGNTNNFQPDKGGLSAVNSPPVSLRCPHCRQLGSFAQQGHAFAYQKLLATKQASMQVIVSMRACPNPKCLGFVFVVQDAQGVLEVEPPELLDFDPQGLPARCSKTLAEAIACHAAGAYRAAAMMVRRLLEEICDENNAAGATLHDRLKDLRNKVVLPEAFFAAMGELKALGNDAAHVEAKAYDTIGQAEAEDSIELAKEIVKALYQLQGLINRLTARKGAAKAP